MHCCHGSAVSKLCACVMGPLQGDDFATTLADQAVLRSEKLGTLRLAACGITCQGATQLARAFESVGGCWVLAGRGALVWVMA